MIRTHSLKPLLLLGSILCVFSLNIYADSSQHSKKTTPAKKNHENIRHSIAASQHTCAPKHPVSFCDTFFSYIDFSNPLYIKHHFPSFYENITYLSPKSTANKDRCFAGICVSGLVNLDLNYFNRRGNGFQPGSVVGTGLRPLFDIHQPQMIGSINNIDLFIDTAINNLVTAHFDLAYVNGSTKTDLFSFQDKDWNTVYENGSALKVNQAYLLFANPALTPLFVQIGRIYANFGDYKPFPIIETLTQLLSEMRTGGVMAGAIFPNGLYATASWTMSEQSLRNFEPNTPFIDSLPSAADYTRNINGKAGFMGSIADLCVNANASYTYNIADVNYILGTFYFGNKDIKASATGEPVLRNQYFILNRAAGLALHADLRYNRFVLGGDFVTALSDLNPGPVNGHVRAWGGYASVDFAPFNFPTTFEIMYQGSKNADIFETVVACIFPGDCPISPAGVLQIGPILPQARYQASITTEILPHINISLQGLRDHDYGKNYNGTGRLSNYITARVSANI
jgi:hypothetical protein